MALIGEMKLALFWNAGAGGEGLKVLPGLETETFSVLGDESLLEEGLAELMFLFEEERDGLE